MLDQTSDSVTDSSGSSYSSAPSELFPPQLQAYYMSPPSQAGYQPLQSVAGSAYQSVQAEFNNRKKPTELGKHASSTTNMQYIAVQNIMNTSIILNNMYSLQVFLHTILVRHHHHRK